MIKTITKFEIAINGKIYHFLCEMDSPFVDAKEAMFQFLKSIGQIEDNAKAVQAQQEAAQAQPVAQSAQNSPVAPPIEMIEEPITP